MSYSTLYTWQDESMWSDIPTVFCSSAVQSLFLAQCSANTDFHVGTVACSPFLSPSLLWHISTLSAMSKHHSLPSNTWLPVPPPTLRDPSSPPPARPAWLAHFYWHSHTPCREEDQSHDSLRCLITIRRHCRTSKRIIFQTFNSLVWLSANSMQHDYLSIGVSSLCKPQ